MDSLNAQASPPASPLSEVVNCNRVTTPGEVPVNSPETAPVDVLPPTQTQIAPPAPHGLKKNGKPKKPHSGGTNGGRPPGIYAPIRTKRIYDPSELAQAVVTSIVQGKGLRHSPHLKPATQEDRRQLSRITGETVESFNERIALSLRDIADLATQRIKEKLEQDQFKAGELGFILSVAHDKRLSLDGSRALNNASVNIQVNNFGTSPKSSLLSELDGLSSPKQPTLNLTEIPCTIPCTIPCNMDSSTPITRAS